MYKKGNRIKDKKGNEYYIIDINYELNIIKYYKNLNKESNKRYRVKAMQIGNFKEMIEKGISN